LITRIIYGDEYRSLAFLTKQIIIIPTGLHNSQFYVQVSAPSRKRISLKTANSKQNKQTMCPNNTPSTHTHTHTHTHTYTNTHLHTHTHTPTHTHTYTNTHLHTHTYTHTPTHTHTHTYTHTTHTHTPTHTHTHTHTLGEASVDKNPCQQWNIDLTRQTCLAWLSHCFLPFAFIRGLFNKAVCSSD
jgi:hypothetical protein